ncbi:UNVERIFIED_CONTAM: hypothetical protein Sradi_3727400 [Sesamum radiatum]|uniref:DUF241 domain protein n=1 Tax=Sesamum radiatum TaxID=300843 RepID=A0AAW2PXY3_SESRA
MAHHARSNSLPSKSHPTVEDFEGHLIRLKSSAEATSSSASSVCTNLDSLNNLHESINNLIQLPSMKQAFVLKQGKSWALELLDGSMRLLDCCGIAKDITAIVKESVQELKSCLRRSRGEAVMAHDIDAYMSSRREVYKRIKKCIKNMKSSKQFSPNAILDMDQDLKTITGTLKEAEAIGFSILKSVMMLLSGEKASSKPRRWSLVPRRIHSAMDQENGVHNLSILNIHKRPKGIDAVAVPALLKQLKASEMAIQEIEEGLESFFRNLVQERVSLLNTKPLLACAHFLYFYNIHRVVYFC